MSSSFPPAAARQRGYWNAMTRLAESGEPQPLADVIAAAKIAGCPEPAARRMLTQARKAGWVRFVQAPGASWSDRDYLVVFELDSCASCGAPRRPYAPTTASPAPVAARTPEKGSAGLHGPREGETEEEKIDRWMREEGLDPDE